MLEPKSQGVIIDYSKVFGDWEPLLREPLLNTPYMNMLIGKLHYEYKKNIVYPEKKYLFRPFKTTTLDSTRVVIIGQDPYFDSRATGLAFANEDKYALVKNELSPSLEKMKECIEDSIYDGFDLNFDPTLISWAKQGVLLLNSALSVVKNEPSSHMIYWTKFTKRFLKALSNEKTGLVFLLLGGSAARFESSINTDTNYVLKYTHPAYAARNKQKWQCPHFKTINEIITEQNGKEYAIQW